MVGFTHISRKNWNREKPKPRFSVQNRTETEPKMKSYNRNSPNDYTSHLALNIGDTT